MLRVQGGVLGIVVAVASTVVLGHVLVERRVAQPLLEPALLRHSRFRAATSGSLVLGVGQEP